MATIKAYSKAKNGNVRLSKNFKVKEFACTDGSDPVFVAVVSGYTARSLIST